MLTIDIQCLRYVQNMLCMFILYHLYSQLSYLIHKWSSYVIYVHHISSMVGLHVCSPYVTYAHHWSSLVEIWSPHVTFVECILHMHTIISSPFKNVHYMSHIFIICNLYSWYVMLSLVHSPGPSVVLYVHYQ